MKDDIVLNAKNLINRDILDNEAQILESRNERYKPKAIFSVLSDLVEKAYFVDFHKETSKDETRTITLPEYVVIVVEETNKLINETAFGLRSFADILYLYNGCYWSELTREDLENFLTDISIKMGVPKVKAMHNRFTDELRKQFLKRSAIPTIETNNKTLVNLLNGTFEVTTSIQRLREPNKNDFLKYQLPFAYDDTAKCPLFDKFLNRVLPDKELQTVLFEFLGYVFIKGFTLQKALILKGNGANGKSVLYEIITAVLGYENVSTFSMQNITTSDSYHLPYLDSKLLNYSSEIGKIIDIDMFKKLVSNEEVDARRIYGEPFKFKSYAKMMFNCNELPNNTEQTDAFFRRFIILSFNQTIPKTEQNPELAKQIITAELSGIFNKILNGLQRVLKNKCFSDASDIDYQIERYRIESDSVALFIDESNYRTSIDNYSMLSDLYTEYKGYCVTNGYGQVSNNKFSKRLASLGYEKQRNSKGTCFNLFKSYANER